MQTPWLISTFFGLAEYFRAVIVPQQSGDWIQNLPRIPITTEELKQLLAKQQEKDELAILRELAEAGSVSGSTATRLELTREVVKEVYNALRDDREDQQNLTEILSATRFKMHYAGKMCHVKCPKRYCFSRDSFQHMLECYGFLDRLCTGPEAVSFLAELAEKTRRPKGSKPIPLPEEVTDETRRRDARQQTNGTAP